MVPKYHYLIAFIFLFVIVDNHYGQAQDFLEQIKSPDYKTRIDSLKIIERSAISDPELFTFLDTKLLSEYLHNTNDGKHRDEMAWICKALASSGEEKYLATLTTVVENTDNKRLMGHCQRSIYKFDKYLENKRVLSLPQISGFSTEMSKNIHMLKSGDYRHMKWAITKIADSTESNEAVYDIVRDVLLDKYLEVEALDLSAPYKLSKTQLRAETLAIFCETLGLSDLSKYKEALQTVIGNAKNAKIKKYAKVALYSLEK